MKLTDSADYLRNWIVKHPQLGILWQEMAGDQVEDAAHDREHCLRVALWALRFNEERTSAEFVTGAALMHDLVNLPKNHPERASASRYSAEQAALRMEQWGWSKEVSLEVQQAIEDHSFSRGQKPRSHLGECLQDADRLEALGALGLFRCLHTGARMGATFFHHSDPWAEGRSLDDKQFSVDHFFTKLLKLPDSFCTVRGKEVAEQRADFLRKTLEQLGDEVGIPWRGQCES
jgi:uncharacterized protein